MTLFKNVRALEPIFRQKPKIGVVLGSGLSAFVEYLKEPEAISYTEIPGMPSATAPGHGNRFILGQLAERPVLAMQGRFHYYEGHSIEQVVYPIRLMKSMGIETLILSNASGGINLDFSAGDLMLITDHINFMGVNPLVGPVFDNELRFSDMSYAYDSEYQALMKQVALEEGILLREGVYIACSGPSYETPAEIRAFRAWGADAVGMSTVPEVIVANALGMRVVAVSCVANMAAGILPERLTEEEVLETGKKVTHTFSKLIVSFIQALWRNGYENRDENQNKT